MQLSYARLKKAAFCYLSLPVLVFLLGFLRPAFGIPAAALGVLALALCLRRKNGARPTGSVPCRITVSKKMLVLLVLAVILWCYLGGQGNLYYQSGDWKFRNAVFRDLITHAWPVRYPDFGRTLVYYIGHWMPPALVGKLVLALGGSQALAFAVGNLALWAWTALGVLLVLLLLLVTVNAATPRTQLLALGMLVFFSGLDLLGEALLRTPLEHQLEWWAGYHYQFSSFTTDLFWVFNQTVAPWLATLVLLHEKTLRNAAFILFCVFLSAPMPFVGLAIYVGAFGLRGLILAVKAKALPEFLKEILSPQNLIGLLVLFPPVALYLLSNTGGSAMGFALIDGSLATTIFYYVPFVICEAGLYLALIWRDNRRSLLYWTSVGSLLFAPLFRVGGFTDYCMRGSIPALLVLMVLVLRWLLAHGGDFAKTAPRRARLAAFAMAACLLIGAVTPAVEFARTAHGVWWHKTLLVLDDPIVTWDQDFDAPGAEESGKYYLGNFSCFEPEKSLFFTKFAK